MLKHNYHHTLWERRAYNTPFERRVREHSGLVIPTTVENHNLLHRNLFVPKKPNLRMMDNILDVLGPDERYPLHHGRPKRPHIKELPEDRFDQVHLVQEMLLSESEVEPSAYLALSQRELARHLIRQEIILTDGSEL